MGASACVLRARRRRALALVAAPLVVLALWNPVGDIAVPARHSATRLSGWQFAAGLLHEEGSQAERSVVESVREREEAPEWFSREVFSLDDVRDIRANDDWTVVGFVRDDAPEEALDGLAAEALSRGWQVAESGVAGTVTGKKDEGRCRWMAISCTAVGGATCIVVQLPGA